MVNTFGVSLIVVCLTAHICEARELPQIGFLDGMPENCTGQYYCLEKHEDYPQKKIDWLLTKKYQIELGREHAQTPVFREGDDDVVEICEKYITYGQIHEIVDEHNNVRVVVQSPNFRQEIRIEECVNSGPILAEDYDGPFGSDELENNELSCVEKKMDYSFLVLTRDGEGVEPVRSKQGIPVCCSCRNKNIL